MNRPNNKDAIDADAIDADTIPVDEPPYTTLRKPSDMNFSSFSGELQTDTNLSVSQRPVNSSPVLVPIDTTHTATIHNSIPVVYNPHPTHHPPQSTYKTTGTYFTMPPPLPILVSSILH